MISSCSRFARASRASCLVLAVLSLSAQAAIKESTTFSNGPKAPVLQCTDVESGKAVECPEASFKENYGTAPVEIAFHGHDFEELDAIYDQVASGEKQFNDGVPYLKYYFGTLSRMITTWERWDADLVRIQKWQRARPTSVAAKLTEAVYWHAYAWNARGTAFASEVRQESWDLYRERIAKAKAVLEEIKPQAKQFPAWYTLRIDLAAESESKEATRRIFDEALTLHRQYYPIFLSMAHAYEPKWGGSVAQFEAFADEAVVLSKGFEGPGMYSRIFWTMDSVHDLPFRSKEDAVPSWTKLNAGFADLLARHPKSHNILNQYASLACRANDGPLYRKLRTQLGDYLMERYFTMVPVEACDRRHQWPAAAKKKAAR
ncbi:DUF4034 domain-containing protein [Massilia sp. CF038]|uniref:DUF4034 domain-containing protein n=1 Tax=Massilia sp. CF038 TaxID=1881045 RepID=UPI000911FF03|nr:DUF4034 domain-containing protein [Massilia sp. CF038]SHH45473.1 protein of unknown function [Massilia sp. CF038]